MATIIVRTCDVCGDTEASEHRISLDSSKPRSIDLCASHERHLIGALRETLNEHGVPLDANGKPAKRRASSPEPGSKRPGLQPLSGERLHLCPLCTLDYASESGLRQHTVKMHAVTLREAREIAARSEQAAS